MTCLTSRHDHRQHFDNDVNQNPSVCVSKYVRTCTYHGVLLTKVLYVCILFPCGNNIPYIHSISIPVSKPSLYYHFPYTNVRITFKVKFQKIWQFTANTANLQFGPVLSRQHARSILRAFVCSSSTFCL